MAVDGSCWQPGSTVHRARLFLKRSAQEQEIFMAKQGESHHHTANVKDIIIIIIIIIIITLAFLPRKD